MAFASFYGGHCWGTDEIEFTNRADFAEKVSDNGAVTLKWMNPKGLELVLQQSGDAAFGEMIHRYEGTDDGSVISGLAEGIHYFRIGSPETNQWSAPLEIGVEFFPRNQLVLLLVLGAIVVLATVGTIIGGFLKHRNGGMKS